MTHLLLWNGHFLKCSGHPVDLPMPFSPVHNALKFSAVFGSLSLNNSKTILPTINKNVYIQINVQNRKIKDFTNKMMPGTYHPIHSIYLLVDLISGKSL